MLKIKVCALIKKNNKFLVLKRSKKDRNYPRMWDIPSGDLTSNETIKQALIREVKEETNLKIKIKRLSSIWEEKANKEYLIGIVFECIPLNGNVKLSEEHEEFRWISKSDINKFKFAYGIKESLLKSNLLL